MTTRHIKFPLRAAILAAALLPVASGALAQEGDGMGLSQAQTRRVVELLDTGFDTCARVEILYRLDCFRQVYSGGAKLLSSNAGYWEAEIALARVGRNLYDFMRANADPKASKLRENGYRMKAITPASLPEAIAVYRTNVARAEELLRSGSATELKYFAPIADLVETHLGDIPK